MTVAKPKLTLAMIVKNEARCLARCLRSIGPVAQEIVVVDTGSTDDTVGIARQFGARVEHFTWVDDFSAARNHALQQASGGWILFLDADEYASESLVREIGEFIATRHGVGRLNIVSEFIRNNQRFTSQCYVSRLFPRGAHFEGRIHEQLVSPLPRVNLNGELLHDGYLDAKKSDRNILLLLRELEESPQNTYYLFQLALEYSSLAQTQEALGALETAYALINGSESFAPNLVVDYLHAILETKQFDAGLAVIERWAGALDDFPDFHFICGSFYMNLVRSNPSHYIALLPRIEQSFKRCLAIGDTIKYKSVKGTGSFLAHYNLGTLYQVFGEEALAAGSFQKAARLGYEPAIEMLKSSAH